MHEETETECTGPGCEICHRFVAEGRAKIFDFWAEFFGPNGKGTEIARKAGEDMARRHEEAVMAAMLTPAPASPPAESTPAND